MLYVSTRSRTDTCTAYRVLHNDLAPDGGLYVPFSLPMMPQSEIETLANLSFGKVVSKILSLFFSTSHKGLQLDFISERYPVKIRTVNHRLVVAEAWHNEQSCYSAAENALFRHVCDPAKKDIVPSNWWRIAMRVATLFGIYCQMLSQGVLDKDDTFDVSVNTGDFCAPMACWYARKMGLPIVTIICSCNENGGVWDLIKRGELNAAAAVTHTAYPELDYSVSPGLERLIHATLGQEDVTKFIQAVSNKKIYRAGENHVKLSGGLFAAVVSSARISDVIRNLFRSSGIFLDPLTAFSYAGLQDYRAKTGESRLTLMLAENSPVLYREFICECCGVSADLLTTATV